jgi:Zn-dependent peptidase ImmA (M78 family)
MPGMDEQLQYLFRSENQSWDERNAHLFMSHLLVPEALLNPLIRQVQNFDWPFLYRLRDMFQVTISVIRIRLERKGLLYVDQIGKIHKSRAEYEGQARMV